MTSLQQRCMSHRPARSRINAESERLVSLWGAEASDMARILAFRAEAGLFHETETGFWKRVIQAVGHRIGLPDEAPRRNALLVI